MLYLAVDRNVGLYEFCTPILRTQQSTVQRDTVVHSGGCCVGVVLYLAVQRNIVSLCVAVMLYYAVKKRAMFGRCIPTDVVAFSRREYRVCDAWGWGCYLHGACWLHLVKG